MRASGLVQGALRIRIGLWGATVDEINPALPITRNIP